MSAMSDLPNVGELCPDCGEHMAMAMRMAEHPYEWVCRKCHPAATRGSDSFDAGGNGATNCDPAEHWRLRCVELETGMRCAQVEISNKAARVAELETQLARLRAERDQAHISFIHRGEAVDGLTAKLAELEAQLAAWKAAVEGLTPSGSEFVNDPAACAAFIRERTNWPRQIIELRAQLAAQAEVVEAARAMCSSQPWSLLLFGERLAALFTAVRKLQEVTP